MQMVAKAVHFICEKCRTPQYAKNTLTRLDWLHIDGERKPVMADVLSCEKCNHENKVYELL